MIASAFAQQSAFSLMFLPCKSSLVVFTACCSLHTGSLDPEHTRVRGYRQHASQQMLQQSARPALMSRRLWKEDCKSGLHKTPSCQNIGAHEHAPLNR